MKKLSVLVMAVLLSVSAFANGGERAKKDHAKLRTEITDMIGHPQVINGEEQRVTLHFTINTKNEVVVLSTNSKEYDNYIKNKLNYKQLQKSNAIINKKYTLPLIIKKG